MVVSVGAPSLPPSLSVQSEEERRRNPFGRANKVRVSARPFNGDEPRQLGLVAVRDEQVEGLPSSRIGSHVFVQGYTLRNVAIKVRHGACCVRACMHGQAHRHSCFS